MDPAFYAIAILIGLVLLGRFGSKMYKIGYNDGYESGLYNQPYDDVYEYENESERTGDSPV